MQHHYFDAPNDDLAPSRPVFVGNEPRRRRGLRIAALACILGCVAFFGALFAGFTEPPGAHEGGRDHHAPAHVVHLTLAR